jgi:hypothetical protein
MEVKSKFEELLDKITAKYEAQGMSNFDARMLAVMSPEAQDQVFISDKARTIQVEETIKLKKEEHGK